MATIQIDVPNRPKSSRKPARSTQASPRSLHWGRLVSEGRAARGSADAGRWRIGHLASLVAKQYGSRSLQAFADDIGETYSTVRRYRWVYTRYEPTTRFRFQQLSFSHFQAVAGLPDRAKWLGRAENGCWSVDELVRQFRKGLKPVATPRKAATDPRATIKDAKAHLRQLAKLEEAELAKASSWIEPALDALSTEIDRLRDRIDAVKGVRVGRSPANGNGNGHRKAARSNGNGNGHRAKARR